MPDYKDSGGATSRRLRDVVNAFLGFAVALTGIWATVVVVWSEATGHDAAWWQFVPIGLLAGWASVAGMLLGRR